MCTAINISCFIVLRFVASVEKIAHYFDVKIVACQITCALHAMRGYIIPNHCITEKCGAMVTLNLHLIGVMKVDYY